MYLNDLPICEKDKDLLNRYTFAKNISDSIMTMDAKDGICLSIQGPWGSGKTSVINLIIECIKENYKKTEPQIIFFTPWNFVSTEDLFIQFFALLADSFSDGKLKRDKIIAEELKKYIGLIDSLNPGLKLASLLATALNDSVSKRNPFDSSNLQKQRNLIVDLIKKQKRKIIVVIDDLDRLADEEIRLVFQLVNSVARFPNIVYLLAYDKTVVVNALTKVQSADGEKYLEKIVQVPISLPEIKTQDIENCLFDYLNRIIHQFNYSFDNDYWSGVYWHIINGKVHNIRSVIRLINSLYVKCTLVGQDVNFVDLIVITFIELYYSDLYDWIKENRKLLTHSGELINFYFKNDSEYSTFMRKSLGSINSESIDEYKTILDLVFPSWDNRIIYDANSLRRHQRIAHCDYVDRYFCYGIDKSSISRSHINRILFSESHDKIREYIESIKSDDQIRFLMKEISASINELDDHRKIEVSKSLLECSKCFKHDNKKGLFDVSTAFISVIQIENLLKNVSDNNLVLDLIVGSIKIADIESLSILADILNTNELALGRLAANGQKRTECTELISAENIDKCENAFVERFDELNKSSNILDYDDAFGLYMILYLYESFDYDAFNRYLDNVKLDNLEILKFVRIFANKMTGTDGISWSFNDEYMKYFSYDIVKNAYDDCLKNGCIFQLSDDSITRLIVFEIWYSKERNANERINSLTVEARKAELLKKDA